MHAHLSPSNLLLCTLQADDNPLIQVLPSTGVTVSVSFYETAPHKLAASHAIVKALLQVLLPLLLPVVLSTPPPTQPSPIMGALLQVCYRLSSTHTLPRAIRLTCWLAKAYNLLLFLGAPATPTAPLSLSLITAHLPNNAPTVRAAIQVLLSFLPHPIPVMPQTPHPPTYLPYPTNLHPSREPCFRCCCWPAVLHLLLAASHVCRCMLSGLPAVAACTCSLCLLMLRLLLLPLLSRCTTARIAVAAAVLAGVFTASCFSWWCRIFLPPVQLL